MSLPDTYAAHGRALELGPLDPEELERMHRIGDHIYGRYKPPFADKGDSKDVERGGAAG